MPTGIIQIKPDDIFTLDRTQPVYQNKYNGFVYVTKENKNKSGLYIGISNRKINTMIKEGYAIKQEDGGVIRTSKMLLDTALNPQPPTIPQDLLDELNQLRIIAQRYETLKDKLFALLEDL